jgi:hypothetical protein
MIDELIPLCELDIEPDVKQLFIDVFRKDPQLRPTAHMLLNRPIISSTVEFSHYFDDVEDAEDLEASPTTNCDDDIPIADMQQTPASLASSTISLHSAMEDKIGEVPQVPLN